MLHFTDTAGNFARLPYKLFSKATITFTFGFVNADEDRMYLLLLSLLLLPLLEKYIFDSEVSIIISTPDTCYHYYCNHHHKPL